MEVFQRARVRESSWSGHEPIRPGHKPTHGHRHLHDGKRRRGEDVGRHGGLPAPAAGTKVAILDDDDGQPGHPELQRHVQDDVRRRGTSREVKAGASRWMTPCRNCGGIRLNLAGTFEKDAIQILRKLSWSLVSQPLHPPFCSNVKGLVVQFDRHKTVAGWVSMGSPRRLWLNGRARNGAERIGRAFLIDANRLMK